jgi:hypothetical protein
MSGGRGHRVDPDAIVRWAELGRGGEGLVLDSVGGCWIPSALPGCRLLMLPQASLTDAGATNRGFGHSCEQILRELLRLAPTFGRLRVRGHRALVRFTAEGASGDVAIRGFTSSHSCHPLRCGPTIGSARNFPQASQQRRLQRLYVNVNSRFWVQTQLSDHNASLEKFESRRRLPEFSECARRLIGSGRPLAGLKPQYR